MAPVIAQPAENALCELADRVAIAELTARYNRAADDGDGEAFAADFTEDGVFEVFGLKNPFRYEGRAALAALALEREPQGQLHVTSDFVVELDGDRARQTCTLVHTRRPPSRDLEPRRMHGRYEDELIRTDHGWLFARRTLSIWF
jgi:uncharacterized protein (TIGR02246 family)